MKSRLKKIAMDMSAFEGSVNQVSQKGREILKSLQDFKFVLEQAGRLLNNNQQLSQGMIQKRKQIDEISNKLYQIVFDIENIDISNSFSDNSPIVEDAPVMNPSKVNDNNSNSEEGMPSNIDQQMQPPSSEGQPPAAPQPPTPGETPEKEPSNDETEDEEE